MKILRSHLGKFPLIELRDPDSGAFFSILPTRGATVHRVGLPGPDGAVREVLCPMRTEIEVERHRWAKGAQLAPWPNRIQDARYEFQGKTYAPPRNFKHQGGHAIHGFEMFETTKLGAKDPDAGWLEFQLASKGWPGYPFPIRITHRFSLSPDGFRMETSLRNEGRTDAPAGHGWHPYFRLGDAGIEGLELAVPASAVIQTGPSLIPYPGAAAYQPLNAGSILDFRRPRPIGTAVLDTCFAGLSPGPDGRCRTVLRDPARGVRRVPLRRRRARLLPDNAHRRARRGDRPQRR